MKKLFIAVALLSLLGGCATPGYVIVPQGATTYTPQGQVTMIAPPAPLGMPAGSKCEAKSSDRYSEQVRAEDGQVQVWRQDRQLRTNVDCKGRFTVGAPQQPQLQPQPPAQAITDYEGS